MEVVTCAECGEENPVSNILCRRSGRPLNSAAANTSATGASSPVEEAAAESLTCPSCGQVNPAGLTKCERCTGPLTLPAGHTYVDPNQRPERPGCVTVFAFLLMIPFCLYASAACYWSVDIWYTPIPIWPPAIFIIIAILALAAILLAIISLTLARGLWRQENWARVVVIGLMGASLLLIACNLASAPLGYLPWLPKEMTWALSIAVLVIQGYTIYWFVRNKEYFE